MAQHAEFDDLISANTKRLADVDLMVARRLRSRPTFNSSNPEFTIIIFTHYKPRIASRLVVDEDDLTWFKN